MKIFSSREKDTSDSAGHRDTVPVLDYDNSIHINMTENEIEIRVIPSSTNSRQDFTYYLVVAKVILDAMTVLKGRGQTLKEVY